MTAVATISVWLYKLRMANVKFRLIFYFRIKSQLNSYLGVRFSRAFIVAFFMFSKPLAAFCEISLTVFKPLLMPSDIDEPLKWKSWYELIHWIVIWYTYDMDASLKWKSTLTYTLLTVSLPFVIVPVTAFAALSRLLKIHL